jgi:hypothetical protein
MAILFWLFVIFIVVGGLFYIVAVIAGVGSVISAKRKGVSLKEQSLANAVAQANKMMEKRKAKERRGGYAPKVQVDVRVVQAAPKDETPEQREAREKREARKRHLDSLVDREPAESEWANNELKSFQASSGVQEPEIAKDGEPQETAKRRLNVPGVLFFGVLILCFVGLFISSLSSIKKPQDTNYNSNTSNGNYSSTSSVNSNANYQRTQPAYDPDAPVSADCARMRIEELKRRTRLEQQGIDTGPSDPLQTPCR